MTIPAERARAVKYAQEFMRDLLDPGITPKVPKAVREMAHRVLRHYPSSFDVYMASKNDPDTWGDPGITEEKLHEDFDNYRAFRTSLYRMRNPRKRRSAKSRR